MDQNRDDFQRRQEKRAELRQKRMQEQKRLRRNLIIAGVVAVLWSPRELFPPGIFLR